MEEESFYLREEEGALNEQRQDEEEHSFHSHVCYDDPYARPLKGKNIVHKAKCTGWPQGIIPKGISESALPVTCNIY